MKKVLLFSLYFCSLRCFTLDGFSQSFYTGSIGITQSNGGRTRVYSDNLTTRTNLKEPSILIGLVFPSF